MKAPWVFVVIFMVAFGCVDDLGFKPRDKGSHLRIVPSAVTMAEGRRQTFGVDTDADTSGGVFFIYWRVSNAQISSVSFLPPGGHASLWVVAPGVTYVIAEHSIDPLVDSVRVDVLPVTARSLELTPEDTVLLVGQYLRIGLFIRDSVGVNLWRPNVVWSSSRPGILYREPSGIYRAQTAGETYVTATLGHLSDSIHVVVAITETL